jgi:hypothetical protein
MERGAGTRGQGRRQAPAGTSARRPATGPTLAVGEQRLAVRPALGVKAAAEAHKLRGAHAVQGVSGAGNQRREVLWRAKRGARRGLQLRAPRKRPGPSTQSPAYLVAAPPLRHGVALLDVDGRAGRLAQADAGLRSGWRARGAARRGADRLGAGWARPIPVAAKIKTERDVPLRPEGKGGLQSPIDASAELPDYPDSPTHRRRALERIYEDADAGRALGAALLAGPLSRPLHLGVRIHSQGFAWVVLWRRDVLESTAGRGLGSVQPTAAPRRAAPRDFLCTHKHSHRHRGGFTNHDTASTATALPAARHTRLQGSLSNAPAMRDGQNAAACRPPAYGPGGGPGGPPA